MKFAEKVLVIVFLLCSSAAEAQDSVYTSPDPVYGNAYYQGTWHVEGSCWLVNNSTDTVWVNDAGMWIKEGQGPVQPRDSVRVKFDLNTGDHIMVDDYSIDFVFGIPCIRNGTQSWIPIHFVYPAELVVKELTTMSHTVRPNPTAGLLYVRPSISANDRITIFDHLGREIISLASSNPLDVTFLRPGLYYILIKGQIERFLRL
jgi:hypothetical protein